jgi:hypothetical protein
MVVDWLDSQEAKRNTEWPTDLVDGSKPIKGNLEGNGMKGDFILLALKKITKGRKWTKLNHMIVE